MGIRRLYVSLRYILGIFFKKKPGQQWLLIKIVVLSLFIRLLILLLPFRYLENFLGTLNEIPKPGNTKPVRSDFQSLARQIKNVSRIVPWESNCLVQATVGKILLRKKNAETTVIFGVKKGENQLLAHAWLSVDGAIILGGENSDQFTQVSSYS
jgi:hypothetical protein